MFHVSHLSGLFHLVAYLLGSYRLLQMIVNAELILMR